MNAKELKESLLIKYPKENDGCEWKEFKNLKSSWSGRAGDDVISYISAISNVCGGHLVLGVEDKTLDIVGIHDFHDYNLENVRRRLAGKCANLNTEKLIVESFITSDSGKTVWVIHIPQHEPRKPVYAHDKAWQRLGDSLIQMLPERLHAIISEPLAGEDWSAAVINQVSLSDLDENALKLAREKYREKHQNQPWSSQINDWCNATFLDKARLTAQGKITRAALLLLGKPESVHFLSPHIPQIVWKLDGEEKAYEFFGPPFILTTTNVLNNIRNPSQKLFPNNQLLAVEILKYETRTILEALHNCIAHQDYERGERIIVTETADRLTFENAGYFVDGEPEDYFLGKRTPKLYRNRWLADAMAQIGMIDTMGYGIHTMTIAQRERFLPLPGYKDSTHTHTKLEVLGKPIDLNYTQMLLQRQDLDLDTVIMLDRVQKRLPISDATVTKLRRDGLIEGRKPNIHVSQTIAKLTGTEAGYTHTKGADKEYLKKLLTAYLTQTEGAAREAIEGLLLPLMPAILSPEQKRNRVKNLLSEMKRDGLISPDREGRGAVWRILDRSSQNV